jgi:hypothetical protein
MKNTKHGGKRSGAGRSVKTDKKVLIAVRLPSDTVSWLRSCPLSQSEMIDKCIRLYRFNDKEIQIEFDEIFPDMI